MSSDPPVRVRPEEIEQLLKDVEAAVTWDAWTSCVSRIELALRAYAETLRPCLYTVNEDGTPFCGKYPEHTTNAPSGTFCEKCGGRSERAEKGAPA